MINILHVRYYTYFLIDPRDESVFYVGSAGRKDRVGLHFNNIARGTHRNKNLQLRVIAILGSGLQPKVEKIFEYEDKWPCDVNEILAISFYGKETLCNITDGGWGGAKGMKQSEEQRAKISAGNKGKIWTQEHREKYRAAKLGKKNPVLAARRLGTGNPRFGKPVSKETRRKMSEARKGIVISEETRARQSLAAIKREANKKSIRYGDMTE